MITKLTKGSATAKRVVNKAQEDIEALTKRVADLERERIAREGDPKIQIIVVENGFVNYYELVARMFDSTQAP